MDDLTTERYPGVNRADLERERAGRPRRKPVRRHMFVPGRWTDHRQRRICDTCGSTEDTTVHQLPQSTMDQQEYERRRVGESADQGH